MHASRRSIPRLQRYEDTPSNENAHCGVRRSTGTCGHRVTAESNRLADVDRSDFRIPPDLRPRRNQRDHAATMPTYRAMNTRRERRTATIESPSMPMHHITMSGGVATRRSASRKPPPVHRAVMRVERQAKSHAAGRAINDERYPSQPRTLPHQHFGQRNYRQVAASPCGRRWNIRMGRASPACMRPR